MRELTSFTKKSKQISGETNKLLKHNNDVQTDIHTDRDADRLTET